MITKSLSNSENFDFESGEVILIDKGLGATSFNVVHKIRGAIKVKKVGHAGTLDPEATGLLIVCTGKKTKEIYKFQDLNKTYKGIFKLGYVTESGDAESDVLFKDDCQSITENQIDEVRKSFLGKIQQMPPMFSAIKFKGKALYKYARKGVEIKREPREIEIYKFEINKIEMPYVTFEITCSKGTYIRVIASDFGERLGCGGYLYQLRRSKIGDYSVDDAFTIDEFKNFVSEYKNSAITEVID